MTSNIIWTAVRKPQSELFSKTKRISVQDLSLSDILDSRVGVLQTVDISTQHTKSNIMYDLET